MKNNNAYIKGSLFKEIPTNRSFFYDAIRKNLMKHKMISQEKEIADQLLGLCSTYIKEKANNIKKKKRVEALDEKKPKQDLKKVLSKQDLARLPDWVKKNIKEAYLIGKSGRVVFVKGKKYHLNNPLNDLPGGEWTYFLRSVINTRYPTNGRAGYAHRIRKIHPSPKPPQLMKDVINFFTKKNEWVLDYFMGVGGTLLGASLCDRKAIGIDLNSEYIKAYKKANEELGLREQKTICGDSLKLLESNGIKNVLGSEKISLICIDPPYGNMMSRKKTGEAIKTKKSAAATPFTNSEHDLGNLEEGAFLALLKESVEKALKYLKNGRYVAIFTKDFQPTKESTNLLHADIIYKLNEITNLKYVGMKIWADESINLYPYGYPWAYVSNQLHQYILFFRKGKP